MKKISSKKQRLHCLLFAMVTQCCGLIRPAAKHHTAVRSPSPLPLWDGGEKWESEACELR